MKAVFVLFDSLNRHMLGAYGGTRIRTPNFDRLARRTMTFDQHYVGSLPCMPARRDMLTGRLTFLHRSWGPLEPFDNAFPELLYHAGIYSHLITDHFHYWEDGGATYHNRYDSYEFVRGQEGDPWKTMVQPHWDRLRELHHARQFTKERREYFSQNIIDREFIKEEKDFPSVQCFARGFEFLDRNCDADNWMLQIETFDPHEPFHAPARFKEPFRTDWKGGIRDWPRYGRVDELPEECEELRANYYAVVSMCDFLLGKLLDYFDTHDLWRSTALVVTTDHGFLLGEHDFWAKNRMNVYQEVAHIPLFLHDPRWSEAGMRCSLLTQSIDIAPTFLDFFNVDRPREMQGISLLKTAARAHTRSAALFGYFGGAVNITDGRFTYHRYPADLENQEIYQYTLMPTHIFSPFSIDDLSQASLAHSFPFTKGAELLKVPVLARTPYYELHGPGALLENDTRLYDLTIDPAQEKPLTGSSEEARLVRLYGRTDERQRRAPRGIRAARPGSGVDDVLALPKLTKQEIRPLVGDLRQCASIRKIVLDDGPERNVRAMSCSTGGGLDFWALSDRSLDLGPVWYRGMPMAWQSPGGFRHPALHNAEQDNARGFHRNLSGFLVTCGLDHIRQPQGNDPLHGRFPFTPANVFAYGEEWDRDEPVLFCEGEITQSKYGGEALRLRRRIEAPIGKCEVRINDTVENLTDRLSRHALLYHFNLGFPAIGPGTEIKLGPKTIRGPITFPDSFDCCESTDYPVEQQSDARCSVRTPRGDGGIFGVDFAFGADTLPCLQIWSDLRPHVGCLR